MSNRHTSFLFYTSTLALCLLMLGAYTRLSDADLGYPDWPGCYGQLTIPQITENISKAEQLFPNKTVETAKAWAEMSRHYIAGILGLLILGIAIWSVKNRSLPGKPVRLPPLLLLVVVIFQALLDMWTVTQLVYPAIVAAHLLGGGMATISLLWLLFLKTKFRSYSGKSSLFLAAGILLVILQISLGGWVSTTMRLWRVQVFLSVTTDKHGLP